ncbi:MAG: hypothetical protein IJS08_08235, partial [Victivallales bacterium]|nr:hypothetical protein [Victivallales bacterium]
SASPELDNLMLAGRNKRHVADDGTHEEATGGWDYYDVTFQVGEDFFEGKINVMITDKGRRFHDVTDLKKDTSHASGSSFSQVHITGGVKNNILPTKKNANQEAAESGKGDVKFSISDLYTGSAADYDKPSLHYIGTGEGAHVYGWGLYASDNREIAKWYAEEDFKRKYETPSMDITYKGKRFQYMRDGEQYSELRGPEHEAARLIFNHNGDIDGAWSDAMDVYSNARRAYEDKPTEYNRKFKEYQGKIVDLLFEGQDSWKVEKHEPSRHLYRQTWFTNRVNEGEANLLDWRGQVTEEQTNAILDGLSQMGSNRKVVDFVNRNLEQDAEEGGYEFELEEYYPSDVLRDHLERYLDFYDATGESVYRQVSVLLGSPKTASDFLYNDCDIDGVKYEASQSDGSDGWNYVSFSDANMRVDEHVKWSLSQRDESLKGVDSQAIETRLEELLAQGEKNGLYRFKDNDKNSIVSKAVEFFDKYAHKSIPLSNGRCVYFYPDKRAFERLDGDNLTAWTEYAIHAVTSSGRKLPGNDFAERLYNPTKADNLDRIETVIRGENVFAKLDNGNPERDAVIFVGQTNDGKRMEVITRLDDYGNVHADLSEVTVLTTKSKKDSPQTRPLSEVVETVAQHQAAGFSPTTKTNILPTKESASQEGEENGDVKFSLISKEEDKAYMDAVKRGDMEITQRMVNEAASKAGYTSDDSWRMDHRAPNKKDGDINLEDLKNSKIVPDDYWEHPEWYQTDDMERAAFWKVNNAIEKAEKCKAEGNPRPMGMWVYRAVSKTKNVREWMFRNGDWVTPIEEYAIQEGRMNPEGYRIIRQYALLRDLYWDGNSIAELGYDDGQNYVYADTANNRKLLDAVTYDDDGKVIPLSRRFNKRNSDTRFALTAEQPTSLGPETDIDRAEERRMLQAAAVTPIENLRAMRLPLMLDLAKQLKGNVTAVDKIPRIADGKALGVFRGDTRRIEVLRSLAKPEVLEKTIKVPIGKEAEQRKLWMDFWTDKGVPGSEIDITETRDDAKGIVLMTALRREPTLANVRKVASHEIGHLVDFNSGDTTSHGNVLGTVGGMLKRYFMTVA